MHMGTAQVPTLSELEAEIERWGHTAGVNYGAYLAQAAGIEGHDEIGSIEIIALTRLTETQKVQAALKVLNGN